MSRECPQGGGSGDKKGNACFAVHQIETYQLYIIISVAFIRM